MLKVRIMHPCEMRMVLLDICRASGRPTAFLLRRLSEPHLHGCVLLEEVAAGESMAREKVAWSLRRPACGDSCAFTVDRSAGNVRLGESRIFPAASSGGMQTLVGQLQTELDSLGI